MATMKKVTDKSLKTAIATVDWAKIDAMTDEDIARQIAKNPDLAPDLTIDRAKLFFA